MTIRQIDSLLHTVLLLSFLWPLAASAGQHGETAEAQYDDSGRIPSIRERLPGNIPVDGPQPVLGGNLRRDTDDDCIVRHGGQISLDPECLFADIDFNDDMVTGHNGTVSERLPSYPEWAFAWFCDRYPDHPACLAFDPSICGIDAEGSPVYCREASSDREGFWRDAIEIVVDRCLTNPDCACRSCPGDCILRYDGSYACAYIINTCCGVDMNGECIPCAMN